MDESVRALCDLGVDGCRAGDAGAVEEVLLELIGALNFEYEEAALGLFRLYDASLDQVQTGRFDTARSLFLKLLDACGPETGAGGSEA
jgi:hypothetical protein